MINPTNIKYGFINYGNLPHTEIDNNLFGIWTSLDHLNKYIHIWCEEPDILEGGYGGLMKKFSRIKRGVTKINNVPVLFGKVMVESCGSRTQGAWCILLISYLIL